MAKLINLSLISSSLINHRLASISGAEAAKLQAQDQFSRQNSDLRIRRTRQLLDSGQSKASKPIQMIARDSLVVTLFRVAHGSYQQFRRKAD